MIGGGAQIPEFFPVQVQTANTLNNNVKPLPKPEVNPLTQDNGQLLTDQVTLSPQARQIVAITNQVQTVVNQVQAVPEVRTDVVERLRATLGVTNNNPAQNAKIAEKLLTEI